MTTQTRTRTTFLIVTAATGLMLASCASGADDSAEASTTSETSTSESATQSPTTSSATSASSTTGSSSSASAASSESPSEPPTDVQIMLHGQYSSEVSPDTFQYSSAGNLTINAEWKAMASDGSYSGKKCASVITLEDPEGNVLSTDRENTCSGENTFKLSKSKNDTGEFTVKASTAPWDTPDDPVVAEKTITVIEHGS